MTSAALTLTPEERGWLRERFGEASLTRSPSEEAAVWRLEAPTLTGAVWLKVHLHANKADREAWVYERLTALTSPASPTASRRPLPFDVPQLLGRPSARALLLSDLGGAPVTDEDLKDRRILAAEGFISIFAVIDPSTGKVVEGPEIRARAYAEDDHVFDDILPEIQRALERAAGEGIRDTYTMQQVIRRTIGGWVAKAHRRKPMIIPIVVHSSRPA